MFLPIHVGNQGRQDMTCSNLERIYGMAGQVPVSESNSYTQYGPYRLVLEDNNEVIG